MRSHKTEAIIIKRNNFGEADRILTVFTRNNGKLKIKARGVRKINSRRASHVELLNFSVLSLYEGPKLPILTEAETINNFSGLKDDLKKIGFAYHICELINELCPEHQENRSIFALLLSTLENLRTSEDPTELVKKFEIDLLTELGFWGTNSKSENIHFIIENLMEKRLKTARILPLFAEAF